MEKLGQLLGWFWSWGKFVLLAAAIFLLVVVIWRWVGHDAWDWAAPGIVEIWDGPDDNQNDNDDPTPVASTATVEASVDSTSTPTPVATATETEESDNPISGSAPQTEGEVRNLLNVPSDVKVTPASGGWLFLSNSEFSLSLPSGVCVHYDPLLETSGAKDMLSPDSYQVHAESAQSKQVWMVNPAVLNHAYQVTVYWTPC